MEMYHLANKWYFQAPIERVWTVLLDMKAWPFWWSSWKRVSFRDGEAKVQLGSLIDNEVRGKLPYSLCFTLLVNLFQPPYFWQFKSFGDLVGVGGFALVTKDNGTEVTYHWDVGMKGAMMSCFAKLPFIKSILESDHEEIMDEFFRGMKARLEVYEPTGSAGTVNYKTFLDRTRIFY
jgi:hypothetical protein